MLDLIQDKSFDLSKINEYKLSIQLSLNGFSFFIYDNKKENLLAFKELDLTISREEFIVKRLKEILENDPIFKNEFASVEVIFYTNRFTLVPEEYYIEQTKNFLSIKSPVNTNKEKVRDNKIDDSEYHILFPILIDLENLLVNQFDNVIFIHPISVQYQKLKKLPESHAALLHFYEKNFYLLIKDSKEVTFINSFDFATPEDVIFYLKSAIKKREENIYVIGFTKEKNQIISLIEKLIIKGEISTWQYTSVAYSEDLKIEKNRYLPLI